MKTFNIIFASTVLLATGCGVDPETLDSLRDVVNTSAGAPTEFIPTEHVAIADELQFDPPNPDRVDPFSFPIDAAGELDQPGTPITTVGHVEVLGFAEVDEPRVFLRTRQTTKSLAVGDTADGVEVIAIHPPAVDLRMGSLKWRATMFDNNRSQN